MSLQTGKLYWVQYRFFISLSPELVVITDISEERERITYYYVNTGRLCSTFIANFTDKYTLSLT